MNISQQQNRPRHASFTLASLALATLMAPIAQPGTILSELGSAGPQNWAILTDANNPQINGPGTSNGNVGVASASGSIGLNSSNHPAIAVNGNLYLGSGVSLNNASQVSGTVFYNQDAILSPAIASAKTASSYFAGLSATSTLSSITSALTINSSGSLNVLDLSGGINLGQDVVLTLSGSSTDEFIVNITNGSDLTLNAGKIDLAGGLTASDVVFNIVGGGKLSTSHGLNDESVINGIVIAGTGSSVQMAPGLINGELIDFGTNLQMASGSSVNGIPPGSPTPEPSTIGLLGSGLVFAGLVWRKRFRKA